MGEYSGNETLINGSIFGVRWFYLGLRSLFIGYQYHSGWNKGVCRSTSGIVRDVPKCICFSFYKGMVLSGYIPEAAVLPCKANFESCDLHHYQPITPIFDSSVPIPPINWLPCSFVARVERVATLDHRVGSLGCYCGFYAFYDFNKSRALEYGLSLYPWRDLIFGVVEAKGIVTLGTRGFRAEKMRIIETITFSSGAFQSQSLEPTIDRIQELLDKYKNELSATKGLIS